MLMFSTAFIESISVHGKGLIGVREEGCAISEGECGSEKATTFWQLRMVGNRKQRGNRALDKGILYNAEGREALGKATKHWYT